MSTVPEYPMASVRKDDLDVLVIACLRHLPDEPGPDVAAAFARLEDARHEAAEATPAPEPGAAPSGDGQWMFITFMGRIEYTGYVTEITKNGQPAYRVDLPEKIWGGNPLAYVEHAASAWFSDRPVTEESVRKAWESELRRAEERRRREAEWARMQEQRAITAKGEDLDEDDEDLESDEAGDGWGSPPF